MAAEPDHRTRPTRWRLHRGGITNIWEYGERAFDLGGGRVILQGTNGSGKSRTLELLLPLCLDGDLHHLGAKGYGTVSIRRLMLDDYTGGPNRIGYAWIELRRVTPGFGEEYLTAGVGVKASRTTQDVASSWRFVTPARVGVDFDLAGPDKTPLDQKELKERIGANAVMDEATVMKQRIASAIYGIADVHRYEDLLHLQRTLRNPDVGVKAVEGQLEEYLSRALPPLDPEIIKRLANQFQDLEAIRENLRRLHLAHDSISRFLAIYARYASGALRERAAGVHEVGRALATHLEAAETRSQELAHQSSVRDKARSEVEAKERLRRELRAQIKELDDNQEYRDLNTRRRLVDALRTSAESALASAATCRDAEGNFTSTVLSALGRVQKAAEEAGRTAADARERYGGAGLDSRLLPVPPAAPSAKPRDTTDYIQVDVDPDAAPRAIERLAPPEVDLHTLATSLQEAATQTDRATHVAEERRTLAITLQQTAQRLEQEHQQIAKIKAHAEEATAAAEQAAADCLIEIQEAKATAQEWLSEAHSWLDTSPTTTAILGESPALPTEDELAADHRRAAQTRSAHREWASPAVAHTRATAMAAGAEIMAIQEDQERLTDELQTCRNGGHIPPPPFRYGSTDRSGRSGAAFYQLVDFHPNLPERQRVGLEAALQACGLLDAWVTPDGTITDPDLQDVLAVTESAEVYSETVRTLASVLVPVPSDDCLVAVDVVARLLAAVQITDNPATTASGGLAVSLTGRWRVGSLMGAWTKDTADHIGLSTREAYRQRRIAELLTLLHELAGQLKTRRQRSEDAKGLLAAWEKHIEGFPDAAAVITAQATVAAAREHQRRAEGQAEAKIEEHAQAEGRWQAKYGELSRQAAEADLPDTAVALAERLSGINTALAAAGALRAGLNERCLTAVREVEAPLAAYITAVVVREEAEARAAGCYYDYAQEAKALSLLIDSLGIDSAEYDMKLSGLRSTLQTVDSKLSRLDSERSKAADAVVKLEALQEAERPNEQQKRNLLTESERQFDAAIGAVGVWAAATGQDQQPPTGRDDTLQIVVGWRADIDEAEPINALQTLRASLPAGYDVTVAYDGNLLTVLVSDGEGSRPVANAAARIERRLAEHREQLSARYQEIFEKFLLRDLAEHLRRQIDAADDLCVRMNAILADAQSSQGVHVQLTWDPSPALDDATREALALVRTSFATRTPAQDARLRQALQERIEAERDIRDAHYSQILAQALDYRNWYAFTVRVRDTGPDGQPRNRLLRRLSSGETRLISYVTLFAAAAAFYDALTIPGTSPLRLVLLDEAFERLDDPTTTRLLELLAELDMDWIITWPDGSAFSSKIDRMHVYDIFRPKGAPGMAFVHTTWDGIEHRRSS